MTEQDKDDAFGRQMHQLIEAMEKYGVAGGTIGSDGVITGMQNWEERTRGQRYSRKARSHGYPLGLAKSAIFLRNARTATLRDKVAAMSDDERLTYTKAFEALAYALDAERFTGSFTMRGHRSFDLPEVDTITENMLTWLEERGHRIVVVDAPAGCQDSSAGAAPVSRPAAGEGDDSVFENDALENLSAVPWQDDPGLREAVMRIEQRLASWRDLRFSERQREGGHSYFLFVPAKLYRQGLIFRYRAKLQSLQGDERAAYRASHEALAYAIDAERFLMSAPGNDVTGDEEFDAINRYTNRLLAWLDDRGYQLVPKEREEDK